MNQTISIVLCIVLLTTLSACNTVYKQQNNCLSSDWFAIGFDAANSGSSANSVWANNSRVCVENNVWVDRNSFDEGYELGLTSFCTEVNGFEFGQRSLSYDEICPAGQDLFNAAYSDGIYLYNLKDNIVIDESNLESHYEIVSDSQAEIDEITYIIKNTELDDKTKNGYFSRRRSLRSDRDTSKRQIETLKAQIQESNRRLAKLEYTLFDKYYGKNESKDLSFSLDKTVSSGTLLVTERAIIIYRPTSLGFKEKSHFNDITKEVSLLVTERTLGNYRYQITDDTDIEFVDTEQKALNARNSINGSQATLLLWDGKGNLTVLSYQDKLLEEILTVVDSFIDQHY